ncbi:MAG: hypothetical protein U9O87_00930 [Verrucomicrobiota bacterium]|nr:hypothetical protein [Verrucomicrobiota bacterium]
MSGGYLKYKYSTKITATSKTTESLFEIDRKKTRIKTEQDGYCYRFIGEYGTYERIKTSPQNLAFGGASNVYQDIMIISSDVFSINRLMKEFSSLPIQYSLITYLLRNVMIEENAAEAGGAKITRTPSKKYENILKKVDIKYSAVKHVIESETINMTIWVKKTNKFADKKIQAENLILGAQGIIKNNPRLALFGYKKIAINLELCDFKKHAIKKLLEKELSLKEYHLK